MKRLKTATYNEIETVIRKTAFRYLIETDNLKYLESMFKEKAKQLPNIRGLIYAGEYEYKEAGESKRTRKITYYRVILR